MQANQVSQAYVLGITEGRASLKYVTANGIDRDSYLASAISNLKALLAQGYSGEARESLRGQFDFARNQLRA